MDEGWIKLHRAIRKNWIWEDPLKLKWWLDILLQANHQERKILLNNEVVVVERGSFHTSILKLSERWKVDRKTVKRFLDLLQKDNMIIVETSKKGTTLKVSNYKDYQAISEPKKDNDRDNSGDNHEDNGRDNHRDNSGDNHRDNGRDTNKNEEELKNENNDKEGEEGEEGEEITPPSPPPLSIPTKYHKLILDQWSEVTYKTWFMDSEIVEDGQDLKIIVDSELRAEAINRSFSKHLGILLGKNIRVEIKV